MASSTELIDRSIPFLDEIKNRTAGRELETWLNTTYGPGTALYDDLARMITEGVRDGWAAINELDGPKYRRSRLAGCSNRFSRSREKSHVSSPGDARPAIQ